MGYGSQGPHPSTSSGQAFSRNNAQEMGSPGCRGIENIEHGNAVELGGVGATRTGGGGLGGPKAERNSRSLHYAVARAPAPVGMTGGAGPNDILYSFLRGLKSPPFAKNAKDGAPRDRFDRTMDISWLDDEKRIGIGVAIWHSIDKMAKLKRDGVTHIINMQQECEDTEEAAQFGIEVLENPTDDDFEPKPAKLFRRGVEFARKAFAERADAKLYIHCAAGVHRAPMMALAVLCSMDAGSLKKMELEDARDLIEDRREVADFAEVYVDSVREFLAGREA